MPERAKEKVLHILENHYADPISDNAAETIERIIELEEKILC